MFMMGNVRKRRSVQPFMKGDTCLRSGKEVHRKGLHEFWNAAIFVAYEIFKMKEKAQERNSPSLEIVGVFSI